MKSFELMYAEKEVCVHIIVRVKLNKKLLLNYEILIDAEVFGG